MFTSQTAVVYVLLSVCDYDMDDVVDGYAIVVMMSRCGCRCDDPCYAILHRHTDDSKRVVYFMFLNHALSSHPLMSYHTMVVHMFAPLVIILAQGYCEYTRTIRFYGF
jgi:hypothetical protein